MNDENIEARLVRWRPARPPSELMQYLHAAVPPTSVERRSRWQVGQWFGESWWRRWPLAYAGLLTAWALILTLRLLTPYDPESAIPITTAQTNHVPDDAPAFAGTLAAERTFFLARNNPDQP